MVNTTYAVTNGLLTKSSFIKSSIVLTEGWPSISLVLEALGFEVETFILGVSGSTVTVLNTLLSKKVKMIKDLDRDLNRFKSLPSVWLQGSKGFIETHWKVFDNNKLFKIGIMPDKERKGLEVSLLGKCQRGILNHPTVGGITLGRWAYFVPNSVDGKMLRKADKVQRSLQHILAHTETGFPHEAANTLKRKRGSQEELIYQGHSRVVPGCSRMIVSTHCVKQPHYPRIKRYMTDKELLDIYDIQTKDQEQILNLNIRDCKDVMQCVVHAVPEKVVYRLVNRVKLDCLVRDGKQVDIDYDSTVINEEKIGNGLEWLQYENDGMTNDVKAARNDDAVIETKQWDLYSVRSYNPRYQFSKIRKLMSNPNLQNLDCTPMICMGDSLTANQETLFNCLRDWSAARFRKNVTRSYLTYMNNKYGKFNFYEAQQLYKLNKGKWIALYLTKFLKSKDRYKEFLSDYINGLEAVHRAANSTFWDWDAGSSLFFWRWPDKFQNEARDGTPVFVTGKLPRYKCKQRWPSDPIIKQKMIDKWLNIIKRSYVQPGAVISLTGSFPVAKGSSDIRMVYDASKCRLNEQIWAPNFMLPTIDMTLRHVDKSAWFGDIDLGEMFLNFPLDEKLRQYTGIDVTELKDLLEELELLPAELLGTKGRLFLRWVRCLMGLCCSPYHAVRAMLWVDDLVRGDRFDRGNIFRWEAFCLNLPGSIDYNPSLPAGYKWNEETQAIAADFDTYVDDIRSSNSSEEGCVLTSRRIASMCNYLGIQDAARKRRFPSKNPGVWCGAKTASDEAGIYTATTQEKWDKGKRIIGGWLEELETSGDYTLLHKPMLSGRGFLVHLTRTYPSMVPFLKGVHHTLESWRRGRSADGWKFSTDEWRSFLSEVSEVKQDFKILMKDYVAAGEKEAPARVKGVKRLQQDLESLLRIMSSGKPPRRLVRGILLAYVLYGFGDASGAGFGSSWESKGGTRFRIGVWGKDNVGKSSNYRELRNLVESLEQMAKEERLGGTVIYFFTDNSTAEAAFFKGSSTSKLLHELVTRLRDLEMKRGCKINLVHVAGERMKWQGSDGLSQGNLLEGVMKGQDMLSYVPLHIPPLKRSPKLLKWILEWAGKGKKENSIEILEAKDWFVRGQDIDGFSLKNNMNYPTYRSGTFIWQPAPAAAEIACEELRKARCKRTESTHIFICPRLLTPYWRSHLHKSCDLLLEIPAGSPYWPTEMFEPLILALYFPFVRHNPWQLRRTPSMLELGERLQRMWKNGESTQGIILCQLWKQARSLEHLPERVVFKMLHCFGEFGVLCERGKKRDRSSLEEGEGQGQIQNGKKR